MNPEVSVIMSAYNTEEYIAKAIESALGQTEKNIEVVLVDDASCDATVEIAKSFSDNRLKVIVNQKNYGQSYSLNRAIKEAQGKWVAILDSDDWFAPDRLEKLLQLAEDEDADMIADDVYFIRNGEKLPWSTLLCESKVRIDKIKIIDPVFFVENDLPGLWGLPLGLTKPLIKRDFLIRHGIENKDNIKTGPDFWFYLTCLAHGACFVFIPKPYYFYRSRPGSLVTASKVKRLNEYCKATRYFLEQDFIKNNPELVVSLSKRLCLLEKTRPYLLVVDRLKQGELFTALMEMIRNPYFFVHLITQLPRILLRRVHYYFPRKIIN